MNARYKTMVPRFRSLPALFYSSSLVPALLLLVLGASLLFGGAVAHAQEISDPLEPVNRATLQFNRGVDTVLVRPLTRTYDKLAPRPVKTGVRNLFSNLAELNTMANDLLQLRIGQAATSFARFAINSTVGLAGTLEVAAPVFGLEKHKQDFGQTLAHWGVGSGPYVVLPLLGPSTVRDAVGTGFDSLVNPVFRTEEASLRDPVLATRIIDTRAKYLPYDELIFGDEYLFIRDLYLQSRRYQIEGETLGVAFGEF